MNITWRERLEDMPELRQFQHWPMIPLDTVSTHRRKAFLRNQQIITQVLNGRPLKTIAENFNLSAGRISQLLDRALGGSRDREPVLTSGLIPNATIQTKVRKQPLPTLLNSSGSNCAFQALLDQVPRLSEALDEMILAKLKDTAYAQRLTPQAFHGEFKRLLAEVHWPKDQYPYTHASVAYESVRQYLHKRNSELIQDRQRRQQPPKRNLGVISPTTKALRAIQIDEHKLDLRNRIHLLLNDQLIPVPIACASVLVAVDVDTTCILGYHLALTRAPNQQDLLALLENCLSPWHPMVLQTPGLTYTPGACFPSGLKLGVPISFGTVQMDNALMHRAGSVIHFLCEQYGATLHLGLPAMPKTRQLIEAVFDYITEHVSKRVASTTGAHPRDSIRESRKNQRRPPLITLDTLDEALSVMLTEANITPSASLGNATPLALFEHQCRTQFVRHVPNMLMQHWHPLLGSEEVTLHWYKHQNRVPHVNFHYERYKGLGLLEGVGSEKKIRVVFDRRDIRTLEAYTLNGKSLGILEVASPWRRFPHSLATRHWIHKNARQHRLNMRDPLSCYFRMLLDNRGKPSEALSLMRVYQEFTFGQSSNKNVDLDQKTSTSQWLPKEQAPSTTLVWNRKMANSRR